jgi:xanthine/CO dehydrogenase XdhC/CoxF family maturation factor
VGFVWVDERHRAALRSRVPASKATKGEDAVARKTIFVSDFSQKEIPDDKQSVQVVLRYADARRGLIVADAHVDDELVKQIARVGKQQARRGRRPKQ